MTLPAAIGKTFRFIWGALDGLRKVLHLILLLLVFAILLLAFRQSLPIVPAKAALVIAPRGQVVEQLSGDPLERAFNEASGGSEPETLLKDLVDAIHKAKGDERIRAIVLDTQEMTGGGVTKMKAIAAALADFKKSGKKVLAWSQTVDQQQYYLLAQADQVYLEPDGALMIEGFGAYSMYFHDALDKLGVDVNVFKVGTHKSFVEPFVRQDMSAEDREQTSAWLGALWQAYDADVGAARKLEPGAISAFVDETVPRLQQAGGDGALMAETSKLIDGRKTRDEFEALVTKITGEDEDTHSYNAVSQEQYVAQLRSEEALERHAEQNVGVVVASGEIQDGSQPPGTIGGDSLAALLRDIRYNDDIQAVVLRIDSGGGSVLASETIRQEVVALREAGKPVVASFSSVAASGGYYIAMNADQIWAEPTTITGSIGIFALIPTFQKTLGKFGVAVDGVGTTRIAGGAQLDRPLGPEVKQALQLYIEHGYAQFIGKVAAARNKTPEEIDTIAQGRVWIGTDAKRLGLVDELGGLDDAVKAAAKKAKLGTDYGVEYLSQDLTWREALAMELKTGALRVARAWGLQPQPTALAHLLNGFERQLQRVGQFNDPRGMYYYCGCDVR